MEIIYSTGFQEEKNLSDFYLDDAVIAKSPISEYETT